MSLHAAFRVFAGCIALALPAMAQTRAVIINGQRVSDAQIAQLEQRNCARIPNGNYWLNLQTGAWGYAGDPRARGVFGAACQRSKSLSERRKLYRPGEILSQ